MAPEGGFSLWLEAPESGDEIALLAAAVRRGVTFDPGRMFRPSGRGSRIGLRVCFSGVEAAQLGWANRAYPADELEERVLAIASRIAQIPSDLVQINKRTVHRAMEIMGLRSSIRAGTELSALATHTESMRKFVTGIQTSGLRAALASDPFALHQAARFDVVEFTATMTAPGAEVLKSL